MIFFGYLLLTTLISFGITFLLIRIMRGFQIVDKPKNSGRKIHKKEIPLGGGLAIFVSFFLIVGLAFFVNNDLGKEIALHHLIALLLGGLILMVGGILDDKYTLRPRYQIVFPIIAALVVVFFNLIPNVITNPFGGNAIDLNQGLYFVDIIVFFWLMGVMFTTKFLDGLDGLVTGVVIIGALMIFFLSRQSQWFQPEVATLAIIFAGSCLGFLFWNWHPAKIFLGEGGSLFTGFIIGCLAIISGGKIATTLLVIGIPMLDVVRVIFTRIQKHKPFYQGDNEHLHFKLVQSGFSQKQTVLLFYVISFLFGITTLFLQSRQKMIALLFLLILMMLIGMWFSKNERQ